MRTSSAKTKYEIKYPVLDRIWLEMEYLASGYVII